MEVLHSLGLSTIGHVAALPRETLPSRFGPELLRRLDQALGEIPEPLVPERPEEPIEAAYGCEPPLENRAAIEIILQRLLERVMKPLERRNAGILQLDIELTVSGHEPTAIHRRPGPPQPRFQAATRTFAAAARTRATGRQIGRRDARA